MNTYATPQESFWAGEFGTQYNARNASDGLFAANLAYFSRIFSRTTGINSVLELGANIGMNMKALRLLLPGAALHAVEINPDACAELKKLNYVHTTQGSLLGHRGETTVDLAFVKGVLIHIAPEKLNEAYDALAMASHRYVLIGEYYNPSPMTIPYRGHTDKLFKRDFAGEFLERHTQFKLVDYGFCYHRDPVFPQDDITWFLLEKK